MDVSESRKRRLLLLRLRLSTLVVALVALTFSGIIWWNAGAPYRAANQFVQSLSTNEWAKVYELVPKVEKDLNRWNKQKFSAFAGALKGHLDFSTDRPDIVELDPGVEQYTSSKGGSRVSSSPMWDTRRERRFLWKLPFPKVSLEGKPVEIQLDVMQDVNHIWRVPAGYVLVTLNRCNRSNANDSIVNLAAVLQKLELPYFCEFRNRMVLTPERLLLFVRGEISRPEMWQALK